MSASLQFHIGLLNQSYFNVSTYAREEIIGLVSEFTHKIYPSDLGLQGKLPLAVCNRNVASGGAQLEFSDNLASTDPSDLGFQGKLPLAVCNRNVASGGAQLEFSDNLASTDPPDLGFQGKFPLAVCNRNVAGDSTKLRFSDELTNVDVTYVGANFHIRLGRHSYLEIYSGRYQIFAPIKYT